MAKAARKTTNRATTKRAQSKTASAKSRRPKNPDRDDAVPVEKKLGDLFAMIDDIGTCMFTTRRADGYLVSRPMQAQHREEDGRLWFVTDDDAHKVDELRTDNHVNLAFYKDGSREWISVSGNARTNRDRAKVRELYKPDWKAWFGDEGGTRNGGPDDPRITLIEVEPRTVEYLKVTKPKPVVLFEVVKGIVTGKPPQVGSERTVTSRELVEHAPLK